MKNTKQADIRSRNTACFQFSAKPANTASSHPVFCPNDYPPCTDPDNPMEINDILDRVFRFLTERHDLFRAQCVSKQWYQVVREVMLRRPEFIGLNPRIAKTVSEKAAVAFRLRQLFVFNDYRAYYSVYQENERMHSQPIIIQHIRENINRLPHYQHLVCYPYTSAAKNSQAEAYFAKASKAANTLNDFSVLKYAYLVGNLQAINLIEEHIGDEKITRELRRKFARYAFYSKNRRVIYHSLPGNFTDLFLLLNANNNSLLAAKMCCEKMTRMLDAQDEDTIDFLQSNLTVDLNLQAVSSFAPLIDPAVKMLIGWLVEKNFDEIERYFLSFFRGEAENVSSGSRLMKAIIMTGERYLIKMLSECYLWVFKESKANLSMEKNFSFGGFLLGYALQTDDVTLFRLAEKIDVPEDYLSYPFQCKLYHLLICYHSNHILSQVYAPECLGNLTQYYSDKHVVSSIQVKNIPALKLVYHFNGRDNKPLLMAAQLGDLRLLSLFYENSVDKENWVTGELVCYTAISGSVACMRYLRSKTHPENRGGVFMNDNFPVLKIACIYGHIALCYYLLKNQSVSVPVILALAKMARSFRHNTLSKYLESKLESHQLVDDFTSNANVKINSGSGFFEYLLGPLHEREEIASMSKNCDLLFPFFRKLKKLSIESPNIHCAKGVSANYTK